MQRTAAGVEEAEDEAGAGVMAGSEVAASSIGDETGTDAVADAGDATAATTDEVAAVSADAAATDDAAGSAAATGDAAAAGSEAATPDEPGSDAAGEPVAGDEPASEWDAAAAATEDTGDAAADSGDEQASADEGAAGAQEGTPEAEEPLVETRVVPDEPVEEADEAKPAVIPPSFDTVRITPDGRAVIAGRAAPGAEVAVRSETVDLGSETANRQGEWTLVPYIAIPPGHHEFLAIATNPDGTQVESDHALIVSVPGPDAEDDSVLAVLVPRDGVGSSTVVQKPEPEDEEIEVAARDDSATGDEPAGAPDSGDETAPATDQAAAEGAAGAEPDGEDELAAETDRAATDESPGTGQAGEVDVAAATDPQAEGEAASETAAQDEDEAAAAEPAEAEGSIVVDTVDYGEEGEMTIAGTGEPDADLNAYIDDEHVGTVKTDETGEWEVTPEEPVEPGSYTLRIDQVDPAGVVIARIETPLVRARPELLMLGDAIVVVQPGNSLWRIARRTMGGGIHFTEIYEANRSQIKDPALIYPGQIFTVPGLESERAQASPSSAAGEGQ